MDPSLYERERVVVSRGKFLLVEGPLQNEDGMIHVKTVRLTPLYDLALQLQSYDFH